MKHFILTLTTTVLLGTGVWAQDTSTEFGDKLGIMPVSNTNRPMMAGTGDVSAKLDGSTLHVMGSYEGLAGTANRVALHSARPGMAGPEIAAVDLDGAEAGDLDLSFELTEEQVGLLQESSLYVVVQTSRNETGELRAWLMAK